jgi:threonine aldolase
VIAAFVIGGSLGGALMWGQVLAIRAQLWRSQTQIRKLQAQLAQWAENAAEHRLPRPPDE